ncbi:hypothetical protein BST61_g10317 [Cercospora zeina]
MAWTLSRLFQPAPPARRPSQSSPVATALTLASGNEEHDHMLAIQPRGIKRRAEDDKEVIKAGFNLEYNSSKVVPSISKMHNDSVSTRPAGQHLLHFPQSIQRSIYSFVLVDEDPYRVSADGKILAKPVVSWEIGEDNKLVEKQPADADGLPKRGAPGLLTVCTQIRELAIPILYVGNSFLISVSNFDAVATQPFWKRFDTHCRQAHKNPILLAGYASKTGFLTALQAKSATLLQFLDRDRSLEGNETETANFAIHRLSYPPTIPLTPGTLQIALAYEPNWKNLLTWLTGCLQGGLPSYALEDPKVRREFKSIESLFNITKLYSPAQMEDFLKTIETHRGHLICDDDRWAEDIKGTAVDETQTLEHATPVVSEAPKAKDVDGTRKQGYSTPTVSPCESPSQQLVFSSSPPVMSSTVSTCEVKKVTKKNVPIRDSLGRMPGRKWKKVVRIGSDHERVEVVNSDAEDDDVELEVVAHVNKKRKISGAGQVEDDVEFEEDGKTAACAEDEEDGVSEENDVNEETYNKEENGEKGLEAEDEENEEDEEYQVDESDEENEDDEDDRGAEVANQTKAEHPSSDVEDDHDENRCQAEGAEKDGN